MSDADNKIKTYKNPARNKTTEYKPYIPQYQVEGKTPAEYQGAVVPGGIKVAAPSTDNPRGNKKVALRQPYANVTPSPIGKGPVPNVGNNMEHTWSAVDSDIVDDLTGTEINADQPMIDNNDLVTDEALGFQNGFTAADIQPGFHQGAVQIETEEPLSEKLSTKSKYSEDLFDIVNNLDVDLFLLIVSGVPVCSGPLEEIEDQARALFFGEHEMCDGNPVPIDDIVILKRVKVKVGLFLE